MLEQRNYGGEEPHEKLVGEAGRLGEADVGAVLQLRHHVDGGLAGGLRFPDVAAVAVRPRLGELGAAGVVAHRGRVRLIVGQHVAVLVEDRDPHIPEILRELPIVAHVVALAQNFGGRVERVVYQTLLVVGEPKEREAHKGERGGGHYQRVFFQKAEVGFGHCGSPVM